MIYTWRQWIVALVAAAVCAAAVPATPANQPKAATAKASAAKSKRKPRYRSSAAPAPVAKAAPVKRRATVLKGPPVAKAVRQEASEGVFKKVADGADIPVENPATLIPFFEQLYRHQRGEMPGPLSATSNTTRSCASP
jgi:hypothetical protein